VLFGQARRQAAVAEVRRERSAGPDAFTIGFARRFATYKRATLLFRDVERLKRFCSTRDAGADCHRRQGASRRIIPAKSLHPRDRPAFARSGARRARGLRGRLRHEVARELVQGVDLWLNTPRRGEEACGTSGMKAGINGVLNLSILDGWFDEAYEHSGGWAIGDREPYSEDQDEAARQRDLLPPRK
jgi:glycogen phosphorylase